MRRKTEAWLVVDGDGTEFLYGYEDEALDKLHDLDMDSEAGEVFELVCRDAKAEAVLRAAVALRDGCLQDVDEAESSGRWKRFDQAVDAYRATKRKVKR